MHSRIAPEFHHTFSKEIKQVDIGYHGHFITRLTFFDANGIILQEIKVSDNEDTAESIKFSPTESLIGIKASLDQDLKAIEFQIIDTDLI